MRRFLASIAVAVLGIVSPVSAATIVQPYPITPNTPARATEVQANFSTIYNAINGSLDASNFANGTGIYASQIIPTNSSQATFGGVQGYRFSNAITTNGIGNTGNITSSGNVSFGGQSVGGTLDGSTGNANITGTVNSKGLAVVGNGNITGNVTFGGGLTTMGLINNAPTTLNGNTSVTGSVNSTGNLSFGGSSIGGTLDASNGNANITGTLNSKGLAVVGNGNITGNVSFGGGLTTAGLVNNAPSVLNGNTSVAGAFNATGAITTQSTVSANGSVTGGSLSSGGRIDALGSIQGKVGTVTAQLLPVIIAGVAPVNQSNAHVEYVRVNNNGQQTYLFTVPFDATPICSGSYESGGPPSVALGFEAVSPTQYRVTTPSPFLVTGSCAGP